MPRRDRSPPRPLDPPTLERLALRYVERFATTRGRLVDYLTRKIRERGWEDGAPAAEPAALAERFAELGYIDDCGYGEARAAAMTRRGLGKRRVAQMLHRAGLGEEDRDAIASDLDAVEEEAARAFARRKRIGPFADTPPDRALREKQIAAMLRAGHSFATTRWLFDQVPEGDE